jgi:hypothetical protein
MCCNLREMRNLSAVISGSLCHDECYAVRVPGLHCPPIRPRPISLTLLLANTVITGFASAGTYLFAWSAGLCADTAKVIVSARPDPGPDQNRCKNDTVAMNAVWYRYVVGTSTNPTATLIAYSDGR